ncbi:hypothetical protein P280DRAFT_395933, partial [Massarina eburnea CBS 473.64]
WRKLGRDVSLSPIEIVKAFAAPMLAESNPNATVKTLLKDIVRKNIRYGTSNDSDFDGSKATLRFDSKEKCARLQNGQAFR